MQIIFAFYADIGLQLAAAFGEEAELAVEGEGKGAGEAYLVAVLRMSIITDMLTRIEAADIRQ